LTFAPIAYTVRPFSSLPAKYALEFQRATNVDMDAAPHSVFICYAHEDNESSDPSKRWLDRLLLNLQPLNQQKLVDAWSDKRIEAGENWHEKIQSALENVRAAVLLISPGFLAAEYIRNSELPVLLNKAKENGVVIIPLILRPSLFEETRFKYPNPSTGPHELSLASLQGANPPTRPLNNLSEYEQDQVLVSVAQRLLRIVNGAGAPAANLSHAASIWDSSVTLFRQAAINYASRAVLNYKALPLAKFFQVPRLRTFRSKEVLYESLVSEITKTESVGALHIVLGDFGSGKSVLLENFAYRLLQEFLESPETRPFPVFGRLKHYKSGEDIQDYVLRVINYDYLIDINKSTSLQLQKSGNIIFLLDGFDEMSARIDGQTLRANVHSLEKLYKDNGCKVILTCRTHFFHTSIDEDILHAASKVYLRSWTDDQIQEYLKVKTPTNWQEVFSRIKTTHNLPELARTPLFLDMIVQSFTEQFESLQTEINSAELYERYSSRWFNESVVRFGSVLPKWDKKALITELAWDLYISHRQDIGSDELRNRIKDRFSLTNPLELESSMNDITNCSFLRRNEKEDVFEFAHLSFMEYFVSEKLASDLLSGNLEPFQNPLRTEIYVFCSEILSNQDREIDYGPISKLDSSKRENIVSLGNIICIIYRLGDAKSFEFLSLIAKSPASHHPIVRNVVITSLGAYSPEKYAPILLEMFEKEENSINKRSIQIQLKYADCSNCSQETLRSIDNAVKVPIELKSQDADAIMMNNPGVISAFEHGLRYHRLNLKKDSRWIIAVNCSWLLTAYGRKDIIHILQDYAAESEVVQIREVAKECLSLLGAANGD